MSSLVFAGIDVSQACLDIAIRPGASFSLTHEESAIATLVEQLCALGPTLIVLEATGGMEIPLTSALATAGLPVVVVNSRQVRDFAQSQWALGEDRCPRCPGARTVRRCHAPTAAADSGCGGPSRGRTVDPATTTGRDVDCREESPAERPVAHPHKSADAYHVA